MALVKIGIGEITLSQPTTFSIYTANGTLLLDQGTIVTREQLERISGIGYRRRESSRPQRPRQPVSGQIERRPLPVFGQVGADTSGGPRVAKVASNKTMRLPSLENEVEFFHLVSGSQGEKIEIALLGVIPDTALIVREIGVGASPLVPGTIYEARLFTGTRLFRFSTQLLPESARPFGCSFLANPTNLSQGLVRKHQRVKTSIQAKLHSGEYNRPAIDIVVNDISVAGAGVVATEETFEVGQSARLSLDLGNEQRSRRITIQVEIRNRSKQGDRTSYGLEFVRLTDEVRKDITDFVLDSLTTG